MLICIFCFFTLFHLDKYIWLKGDWHPLERVLSITSPKSGWVQVSVLIHNSAVL